MPWAVDDTKKLRERKEEVDQLRDEEEHQSLGEVTKDTNDCESHTSTVAESITNEDLWWEFVAFEES